jgi:hypothetical protein
VKLVTDDLEEEGPAVALIILGAAVPAAIEALGRVRADRQDDVAPAGRKCRSYSALVGLPLDSCCIASPGWIKNPASQEYRERERGGGREGVGRGQLPSWRLFKKQRSQLLFQGRREERPVLCEGKKDKGRLLEVERRGCL